MIQILSRTRSDNAPAAKPVPWRRPARPIVHCLNDIGRSDGPVRRVTECRQFLPGCHRSAVPTVDASREVQSAGAEAASGIRHDRRSRLTAASLDGCFPLMTDTTDLLDRLRAALLAAGLGPTHLDIAPA